MEKKSSIALAHMNKEQASDSSNQIQRRLQSCLKWVDDIVSPIEILLKTSIDDRVSFTYTHSAPTDVLSTSERAQALSFLERYTSLPDLSNIEIQEDSGKAALRNAAVFKSALNDFRPIIMNPSDVTH